MAMQMLSKEEMRVPSKQEIGQRIKQVRHAAQAGTREISLALNEKDQGLINKLEQGVSLSFQRMVEVANYCAGRGYLIRTSPQEVLDFLEARTDELAVVIDGSNSYMSYLGTGDSLTSIRSI